MILWRTGVRLRKKLEEQYWLKKALRITFPLSQPEIKPFFIVSSGRSGTTLLRKYLVNHPLVHLPPESDDLLPYNAKYFIKNNNRGWGFLVESIVHNFEIDSSFKYWNVSLADVTEQLKALPQRSRSYASIIDAIYRAHGRSVGKVNIQVWGDKTPYLIFGLPWLRAIFPEAKYIHLIRDGRAVVESMMAKQDYQLKAAAVRWRDAIRLANSHFESISAKSIVQLKYEAFVSEPATTLNSIARLLQINNYEKFLNQTGINLGDDILKHHDNLHRETTTDFVEKWRTRLPQKDIEFLNAFLSRELSIYNYALS
ncbi:MAG TPA: sulfotransferase [Chryseosolibacter sp.]